MRVTNSLMANNYLRNLNRQTSKVMKYQDQLSSLKEVSRPSDDPMAVSKIMDLNTDINQNEQYLNTIEDAIDWTNVQDSALAQATNSLQRIRTLVQSAGTDTMSSEGRQAVKSEIEGEIGTLTDALNTNFGGRYVFAGQDTTEKPFVITTNEEGAFTGITYAGSNENLPREVSSGVTVDLLSDGSQLESFGDETLGGFLSDVLTALDNNDTEALSGELLETADAAIGNTVNKRTEVGAIFNRLEASKERNESEKLNLLSMRSNEQDVDLAEKYMEFSMEMIAYQASLQMGTQILQTNIMNYM